MADPCTPSVALASRCDTDPVLLRASVGGRVERVGEERGVRPLRGAACVAVKGHRWALATHGSSSVSALRSVPSASTRQQSLQGVQSRSLWLVGPFRIRRVSPAVPPGAPLRPLVDVGAAWRDGRPIVGGAVHGLRAARALSRPGRRSREGRKQTRERMTTGSMMGYGSRRGAAGYEKAPSSTDAFRAVGCALMETCRGVRHTSLFSGSYSFYCWSQGCPTNPKFFFGRSGRRGPQPRQGGGPGANSLVRSAGAGGSPVRSRTPAGAGPPEPGPRPDRRCRQDHRPEIPG